jgi:hypothetical protein
MRTHKLKLALAYCDAVLSGEKSFEIRFNDRGFQKGDRIQFQCIDEGATCAHKINKEEFVITYALAHKGLADEWIALSIKKVPPIEDIPVMASDS